MIGRIIRDIYDPIVNISREIMFDYESQFEINYTFVKCGKRGKSFVGAAIETETQKAELRNSIGDNVAMRSNRISTHRHTPYTLGILLYIFYTMSSRRSRTANTSKFLHSAPRGCSSNMMLSIQRIIINRKKKLGNFLHGILMLWYLKR